MMQKREVGKYVMPTGGGKRHRQASTIKNAQNTVAMIAGGRAGSCFINRKLSRKLEFKTTWLKITVLYIGCFIMMCPILMWKMFDALNILKKRESRDCNRER